MEPPPTPLQEGAPARDADGPPDDRSQQVTDRARERDHDVGRRVGRDPAAEERHVLAGERPGGERAAVGHHELARGRKDRVEGHQAEHGVDAVIPDRRGDRARNAGEEHRGRV